MTTDDKFLPGESEEQYFKRTGEDPEDREIPYGYSNPPGRRFIVTSTRRDINPESIKVVQEIVDSENFLKLVDQATAFFLRTGRMPYDEKDLEGVLRGSGAQPFTAEEIARRYSELEKEVQPGYVPDYPHPDEVPEIDPSTMTEEEKQEMFASLTGGGMYDPDARELLWPESREVE